MPAEAVLRALRHVWLTLEPLGMPMAVVGGIALATWRHVRATRDVDLLLGVGEHDPNAALDRLRAADVRPKGDPAVRTIGQLDVVQLSYEPPDVFVDLKIDLLLAKSGYHLEALDRRVLTRLPELDVEIAVLACEDMILHKLLAGRIIDRADAAGLLRANRSSLDLDYLTHWIGTLSLTRQFDEIWDEALPGEPLPDVEKRP
jgi:hypothetical protein